MLVQHVGPAIAIEKACRAHCGNGQPQTKQNNVSLGVTHPTTNPAQRFFTAGDQSRVSFKRAVNQSYPRGDNTIMIHQPARK